MPSSALALSGLALIGVAVALLWATVRLRREVADIRRLLHRVTVAADEVERVDGARRRLGDGFALAKDGAIGVNRVVRRSGQTITGIPYALLESIGRIRRGDDAD